MTTENQLPENVTEDQLQDTNVAKGFKAFSYISDLMQRYPFDLKVARAGRIFVDNVAGTKLRRKLIKGQPQQNYMFEAYKTIDNNNVVQGDVEISSEGFTPSMLIAAVAAKVANEEDSAYNRIAIMLLQGASALLQEGNKSQIAERTKLNPEGKTELSKFYKNLSGLHARAYTVSIIRDILQYTIGDNEGIKDNFTDNLEYINQEVNDEIHGAGARTEGTDAINMVLASITNLAFSQVYSDVQIMADETKENIGKAALVEISGEDSK